LSCLSFDLGRSVDYSLPTHFSKEPVYSYYLYQKTLNDFLTNRQVTQQKQANIARAISNESFFVLERFTESIIITPKNAKNPEQFILNLFDQYWEHWELIWELEGASFYTIDNKRLKHWGKETKVSQETLHSVFTEEIPYHQFDCTTVCFQQIITPVLINSKLVGAISLSVSLSDTLLQYQETADGDIGLLISDDQKNLSAVTHAEKNTALWQKFRENHELKLFTNNALDFISNQSRYEIKAFSIKQNQEAPYFVMINDISREYSALQEKLYQLAAIGFAGLFFITIFLYITIQLSSA
jgi:hypothetical protein